MKIIAKEKIDLIVCGDNRLAFEEREEKDVSEEVAECLLEDKRISEVEETKEKPKPETKKKGKGK